MRRNLAGVGWLALCALLYATALVRVFDVPLTADTWGTVADWALVVLAAAAGIIAVHDVGQQRVAHAEQMRELKDSREASLSPWIAVQRAQFTESGIRLWIRNVGPGPSLLSVIEVWAVKLEETRHARVQNAAVDRRLRERAMTDDPDVRETFRALSSGERIEGEDFELLPEHLWPQGNCFGYAVWRATVFDAFGNQRETRGGLEVDAP